MAPTARACKGRPSTGVKPVQFRLSDLDLATLDTIRLLFDDSTRSAAIRRALAYAQQAIDDGHWNA